MSVDTASGGAPAEPGAAAGSAAGPMAPLPYRVTETQEEAPGVVTISISPLGTAIPAHRHGQFNMLTAFGLGESAISLSGSGPEGKLVHTVRDVGPVTSALCGARPGDVVGVRGPFGTGWGVEDGSFLEEGDVVVVAGGIGLAPLRGAISALVARRSAALEARTRSGNVCLVIGAREPQQLIFGDDLARWAAGGARVTVTVDIPDARWRGGVGLVTSHLGAAGFEVEGATALICGPEIMMRFTARGLVDAGVAPERIRVALERNMQCGLAWCGHCQLGPLLVCRDGPVVPYTDVVADLLVQRER